MKKLFFVVTIISLAFAACVEYAPEGFNQPLSIAATVQPKKAPVLQIGTVTATTTTATVPVTVKQFANVVGSRMKIKYDPTIVRVNGNPVIKVPGAMVAMNTRVSGEIVISWLLWPGKTANIPDGQIMAELPFKRVKVGTSQVYFLDDQGGNACSTRYAPNDLADDTPFSTYYLPGSVTFE